MLKCAINMVIVGTILGGLHLGGVGGVGLAAGGVGAKREGY